MPVSEQAGRANRPDIKEIVSHTDDLKELLEAKIDAQKDIMDERDRRYEDRFRSMDEKTSLALAGSEKAGSKAEAATEKRFEGVNEMRGSLNDMTLQLLTKAEANAKFNSIDQNQAEMKNDIISLREFRSAGGGKEVAHADAQAVKQFDIRTILTIISMLVAFAALFFKR